MQIIKQILSKLYLQVIIAIITGVILGYLYPNIAIKLQPLSDGFLKLIKMIIAPLIFCTIVTGISGMKNIKSLGKIGGIAFLYFEIVSSFALIIGLVIVNIVKPGIGMNIDVSSIFAENINQFISEKPQNITQYILNIIPTSIVSAFTSSNILQIILVALLFGSALNIVGDQAKIIFDFIEQLSKIIFKIIDFIMKLAPIGAFGAIAFTIGKYGVNSLIPLMNLMLCFYVTCILFISLILGTIAKYAGINLFKLLKYIKDEIFLVIGTSSSESVLPKIMEKLEKIGCDKATVALIIPTGYSFNLDGTSIYLTMSSMFLAQATNVTLSIYQQISLLILLMISSKGAAAVTNGAFIVLVTTLSASNINIPVETTAIIFGINRFMSEMVSLTNMIGNSVATLFISKIFNKIDTKKLNQEFKAKIKLF